MYTNPQQVIEALCEIVCNLNNDYYNYMVATDCFCNLNDVVKDPNWEYRFNEEVIEFIKEAIEEKIERMNTLKNNDC